ncbi:unnamed protein product [Discosporangium mesarthrocarpum]
MADFLDFNSRASKLQKEQQKRREAARFRVEKERKAKANAARIQAQVEDQVRQKRLEQLRKEEKERKQAEEDMRRTGGVSYKQNLRVVAAEGEGDKIVLPPSALESLSRQDAVSMGPMLFELTLAGGETQEKGRTGRRRTHGGVLEFIAEEGTVGLPRKVVRSLGGIPDDAGALGEVSVRYVRLAKALFARVVPETIGLSQVSELRAMLEHNMRNHATLSVGDRLQVWRRGKEFSLKVVELRPEPETTVIDTDLEIDLELPEVAKKHLEEQEAQERSRTLRAYMHGTRGEARQNGAGGGVEVAGVGGGVALGHQLGGAGPVPMDVNALKGGDDDGASPSPQSRGGPGMLSGLGSDDDSSSDSEDEGGKEFDPEAHRLALPEEPQLGEDGVVTCQLRGMRGEKFLRRFRRLDRLRVLFDFAEANGFIPGQYRVVVPYPRRVLAPEDSGELTLEEAGLTAKQEALILEHC